MKERSEALSNLKALRYGVIYGTALFLFFGVFDFVLLGDSFLSIFYLRFILLLFAFPVAAITLFKSRVKLITISVIALYVSAVLLYAYILYKSSLYGEVFFIYQFGYIIFLLWIGFVFRTKLWHTVFMAVLIIILNNIVSVLNTNLNISVSWMIGINLLLLGCFSLIILGVSYLKSFEVSIRNKNETLYQEKLQLQKAKEKAEQADHLKTAFLANLSHEIRTPLNAVAGFSAIIAEEDIGKEERLLYSKCIVENSEDLVELIEDIINFSVIESNGLEIKKENVNINDVFDCIKQHTQRLLIRYNNKENLLIEKKVA